MLGSFFLLLKSSPLDFYRFYQEPPGICETFLHWHPFKSTSFSYILSYTPEISSTFSFGISISSIGLWGFSLKRRIRLQNRKISYTSCIRGVTWNKSFFFQFDFLLLLQGAISVLLRQPFKSDFTNKDSAPFRMLSGNVLNDVSK